MPHFTVFLMTPLVNKCVSFIPPLVNKDNDEVRCAGVEVS